MTHKPLVTTVIPAYNAAETLAETLESVQAQTCGDWECIVVDDGSTDKTGEVAAQFADCDSRFSVITKTNGGIAAGYNTGVAQARGSWFVMLSADDLLAPLHVKTVLGVISHVDSVAPDPEGPICDDNNALDGEYIPPARKRGVALISCNGHYLYDDGAKALAYADKPWFASEDTSIVACSNGENLPGEDAINYQCSLAALFNQCLYSTGIAINIDAFSEVGGFRANFYAEDYELFLRLLAFGYQHIYIPEPLSIHRRNDRQRSASGLDMRIGDLETLISIVEEFGLHPDNIEAFAAAESKLKRNIKLRRWLYSAIGGENAERLITKFRR